jgi:hypothetical protein
VTRTIGKIHIDLNGKPFKTERPILQVIDEDTKNAVEKLLNGEGRESQETNVDNNDKRI